MLLDINNFEFIRTFFATWTFDKDEYFTSPVISKDEDVNEYKVKLSERHFKYIRQLNPKFDRLILFNKDHIRTVIPREIFYMKIEMDSLDKEYLANSFSDNECRIIKEKILEIIEHWTGYKLDKVRKLEKKDN